jgi:DNA-binding MarR family transcriptional regulator
VAGRINPLIPTLARTHLAASQETAAGTGLSAGQELIVMRLFDSPSQSQAELTRWLGIEPPTTAKMLARMEKAGILQRVPSDTDRRVMLVSLTTEGRRINSRVATVCDDLGRRQQRGSRLPTWTNSSDCCTSCSKTLRTARNADES